MKKREASRVVLNLGVKRIENLQSAKRDTPLILHRMSASSPGPVRCQWMEVTPDTVVTSLMKCTKQWRLSSVELIVEVVYS